MEGLFPRASAPELCRERQDRSDQAAGGRVIKTGHRAPALGGRYLLQVRDSVQEANQTVDQHALEAEPRAPAFFITQTRLRLWTR